MEMADGRIMIYGYATFRFTDQKVDARLEAFTMAAISAGKSAKDSVSLAYEAIKELDNEQYRKTDV